MGKEFEFKPALRSIHLLILTLCINKINKKLFYFRTNIFQIIFNRIFILNRDSHFVYPVYLYPAIKKLK